MFRNANYIWSRSIKTLNDCVLMLLNLQPFSTKKKPATWHRSSPWLVKTRYYLKRTFNSVKK